MDAQNNDGNVSEELIIRASLKVIPLATSGTVLTSVYNNSKGLEPTE